VDITPATALTCAAVYAAVRVLAETVAQVPLHIYRRGAPVGGVSTREVDRTHPLEPILHDRANGEQTAFEFREMLQGHCALRGNALAEIVTDGGGQVVALWPLHPDRIRLRRTESNRQVYVVNLPKGGERVLLREQVLHLRLGGGAWGESPIALAAESLGLTLAAEEYAQRYFGQGAEPRGVLQHPGQDGGKPMGDAAYDRLKESWAQNHQGLENVHRIAILEEGTTWQQVGISPKDSQLIEGRQFQVEEVARWFNLPQHKIGAMMNATFSNIEQQGQDFVTTSMLPWFVRWEQALKMSLLSSAEQSTHYCAFVVAGLMRGDAAARGQFYTALLATGAISPNEISEREDLPPSEGGNVRVLPLQYAPIEQAFADDWTTGQTGGPGAGGGGNGDGNGDGAGSAGRGFDEAEAITAANVLNGAQVSSLVGLAAKVAAGELSKLAGVEIMKLAFGIDPPAAERILSGAKPPPDESRALPEQHRQFREFYRAARVEAYQRRSLRGMLERRRIVDRFQGLIGQAVNSVLGVEVRDVGAMVKRNLVERAASNDWDLELEAYYGKGSKFRGIVERRMTPAFDILVSQLDDAILRELGLEPAEDPETLPSWVSALVASYVAAHCASSQGQLGAVVRDADDLDTAGAAVKGRLDEWKQKRATKTARKQTKKVNGDVYDRELSRAGVPRKKWKTRGKTCPFCKQMDGKTAAVGGSYFDKGDKLSAEGQSSLEFRRVIKYPPLHGGCDCEIVADF
jgi:HK97 family phage portal protein